MKLGVESVVLWTIFFAVPCTTLGQTVAPRGHATASIEWAAGSPLYDGSEYTGPFEGNQRRVRQEPQWRVSLRGDTRLIGPLAVTAGAYVGKGRVQERHCFRIDFDCFPEFDRDLTSIGAELGLQYNSRLLLWGSALSLRGGAVYERARIGEKNALKPETLGMPGTFIGGTARRALSSRTYLEFGAAYRAMKVPTKELQKNRENLCGCLTQYEKDYGTHTTAYQLGVGVAW